jgi:type II secretory pathway predicted ATPase ExeA
MHNNFYGFDRNPFTQDPDTDSIFFGKEIKKTLSNIKEGLSANFGMMVITGDMGTGKSILAHSLLNRLKQDYKIALLTTPRSESLEEMLKNVFIAFGIKTHANNSIELSNLLFENFLTTKFWKGEKVVIIIDEAHNLSEEQLKNTRLLSKFTINNKQVVQFILVGQKTLIENLKKSEFDPFFNHIALFEELNPYDLNETHQYILHRLKSAGSKDSESVFTQRAYGSIYEFSGGVPNLIDHICDLALVSALSEKIKPIDSSLINAVANGKKSGFILTDEQSTVFTDDNFEYSD